MIARPSDLAFAASLCLHRNERRLLGRWWRSRAAGFVISAQVPWIVFDAFDALEAVDLAGRRVFEYGSGGSTLYWLRRGVAEVVSAEHDPSWYRLMWERAGSRPALQLRLVEPEPRAGEGDPANPSDYASADDRYRGFEFRRYASQIDEFPDGHFDVVLVDGRARPSCIRHAASKVAPDGLLVIDNADRPYYFEQTKQDLLPFGRTVYRGAGPCNSSRWETAILRRDAVAR